LLFISASKSIFVFYFGGILFFVISLLYSSFSSLYLTVNLWKNCNWFFNFLFL